MVGSIRHNPFIESDDNSVLRALAQGIEMIQSIISYQLAGGHQKPTNPGANNFVSNTLHNLSTHPVFALLLSKWLKNGGTFSAILTQRSLSIAN